MKQKTLLFITAILLSSLTACSYSNPKDTDTQTDITVDQTVKTDKTAASDSADDSADDTNTQEKNTTAHRRSHKKKIQELPQKEYSPVMTQKEKDSVQIGPLSTDHPYYQEVIGFDHDCINYIQEMQKFETKK